MTLTEYMGEKNKQNPQARKYSRNTKHNIFKKLFWKTRHFPKASDCMTRKGKVAAQAI